MKKTVGLLATAALGASLAVWGTTSQAADHLDAPAVKTDGRTDITDIYAFQSKENPANTVLIMDVNPLAGVISGTTFDPHSTYRFFIDNNGDAISDTQLSVEFEKADKKGRQNYEVKLDKKGVGHGRTGDSFRLNHKAGRAWAGVADDPFFFDLQAFKDQVKSAGGSEAFCDGSPVDFFAGTNVSAIVLEVPSAWLTGATSTIGVWAQTIHKKQIVDQMGRPAINTVFVPEAQKDSFNHTQPADMRAAFGELFTDDLVALSGGTYSHADAEGITNILLPDILTVDTASPAGFLNGRQPSNDVIDAELNLVTNGGLTSDCVNGNDATLPQVFPYLAPAH